MYLVNYSGLQLPLVQSVKTVAVHYRVPEGKAIATVGASTPDSGGLNGFATVTARGNGVYRIEVPVDQFALLTIALENTASAAPASYAGPQFDDPAHAEAAESGLAFVLANMRNGALPEPNRFGVHTNLLDNEDSTEIYTNGHNVTGEHMGLLLRTSACMGNQTAFEEAYRYAGELMQSPLYHVPNWSIDKNRQAPFVFYDDFRTNWYNANAPLDDLRLIHGLIDGYENFGHDEASGLADEMFEGLYWTTVTDRSRNPASARFPDYAGGLLGFAWDWAETDDATLSPAATATGTGYLGSDLLPVDYQDLGAIVHAAERDHRWESVLQSTTALLLDSEISLSGLYYNGYRPDGSWTGDFEYQGTRRGEHLKTIQVLWTAIHLARVATSDTPALSADQKALAQGSAARSLAFFKNFYQSNGRVPEYLTLAGTDVDDCVNGSPANCLGRGTENLFAGEARIYAQISRLALLLGDKSFSTQVIDEKIITDRIGDTGDARYGMIGLSTAGSGDAEAWNVLESVFSVCLNALEDDDGGSTGGNNSAPQAVSDQYSTNEETALALIETLLLANDTDADGDTLRISGLPSRSSAGGRVERLASGDWLYTPAAGFSGTDTLSYAISDGQGGSAIGQIEITVRAVEKSTHLTDTITITTGTLDYGSVAFLTSDDADTYDIASASSGGSHSADWHASTRIANPEEVSRLIVTLAGHYSIPNVTQETYLYNVGSGSWDSFDTRIVGDESDSVVRLDIAVNAGNYLAADGETRLRVRSTHASQSHTSWANSLQWLAYRGNQATGNRAPVAAGLSVSTTAGSAVAVTLSGSDADGDTLSFTIDTSATVGTVSGTPPALSYTPPAGFTGQDRFTYTVSDGAEISAPAEVSVSVLQPGIISNIAAAITLDGDLGDWTGYIPFAEDPVDISGANNLLDWRQAWMAHDGTDFYIAYTNAGEISPTWGQTVYFDIDSNAATGLQNGLPLGADRVLQGRFLYRYAGTGSDWNWEFIAEVVGTSINGNFEYRFPRSAFDNSEDLLLAFVGSSEPFGGTAEDLYPDGVYDTAATERTLRYAASVPANSAPVASDMSVVTLAGQPVAFTLQASDANGDALSYAIVDSPATGTLSGTAPDLVYNPASGMTGEDSFTFQVSDALATSRIATVTVSVQSVDDSTVPNNPVTALTVDGDLSDWQGLRFFDEDPDDVSGAENPVDYRRAAMAHDAGYVYLTFSNDGQDLALLEDWLYTVYIDTDGDASTGYYSGLAIGADIMQQGGSVFTYAGTGQDWTWSALAGTPRAVSGSSAEIAIPRQVIGDPSGLRLVLIGDNLSIGGGIEDVYPDGTYSDAAAVRYFEYSTQGVPSEPVALAAHSDEPPVSGRELLTQNAVELTRPASTGSGGSGGSGAVAGLALVLGWIFAAWLFVLRRRRSPGALRQAH